MPFVNVRKVKGLLTATEKRELRSRITRAVVDGEGKGNPAFLRNVMVLIEKHEVAARRPVAT